MTTPSPRPGPQASLKAPEAKPKVTGLTSVAEVEVTLPIPSAQTDRWELGYAYLPRRASRARNRSQITQAYGENLADPEYSRIVESVPWLLVVEDSISAMQFSFDDYQEFTRETLETWTTKLIERELWTGEIARADETPNRYLASPEAEDIGTFASMQHAVAALVGATSAAGAGDAVVHVPRSAAVLMPDGWTNADTLEHYGFSVSPGAGYPGTGPDGTAPATGSFRLYSTETVYVHLSGVVSVPENLSDAFDPRTNTITYYAERFGSADFAGPVFTCTVTP